LQHGSTRKRERRRLPKNAKKTGNVDSHQLCKPPPVLSMS
jgi:hypothetical protein